MTDTSGWRHVPDDELAAFHQTADIFLNTANGLLADEPAERVGAAFLYAGCRFTAFAMQAQLEEGQEVDAETRDWLTQRFDEELHDHAMQHLRSDAMAPTPQGLVPDAAIDVLMSTNEMEEEPRRAFLRLADRFIHPANGLIDEMQVSRISAAMMHACTRFNAYVMQSRGLAPGPLEVTIATDFRNAFRALLDFHLGQSVITDRDG